MQNFAYETASHTQTVDSDERPQMVNRLYRYALPFGNYVTLTWETIPKGFPAFLYRKVGAWEQGYYIVKRWKNHHLTPRPKQ